MDHTTAPVQIPEKRVKNLAQHNIVLLEKIKQGNYSEVWKALLEGKENVTIKFFTKNAMNNAMRELSFIGAVTHMNVIKYRKFVFEESAIVMDFASNGNVYDFLKKQTEPIDWRMRMKWTKDLAETLKFLHEKGIIHRDIRCVNLLLNENMEVRIADFGISIWKGSENNALPVHVGKEHYKVVNDKATTTFNFDYRLLGIVLAKLLLFGDDLDKDLWDTKTNSLKLSQLNCHFMPYLQLVELCLSPSSKIGEILDAIDVIMHDPQLPIPIELIVPKLLEDLPKGNDEQRISAAKQFGDLGKFDAKVIDSLKLALSDSNMWVRRYSAKSLGSLLKKSNDDNLKKGVVAALVNLLSDKEKSVRVDAIRSLALLGRDDAKTAEVLVGLTQDPTVGVRMEAAEALGEVCVNGDAVSTALIQCLADADAWVRMKAALSLAKFVPNDKNHVVTKALQERVESDLDQGVKWAAEKSLKSMSS